MTGWLASVADAAEVALILPARPDILDLKDPTAGALGAWATERIVALLRDLKALPYRPTVSATIGDQPMRPAVVLEAARRVAGTGVDIVKVGIVPDGEPDACLEALGRLAADGVRLVAVVFADLWAPGTPPLERIAAAGFAGAMLDTADKRGGGLRRRWSDPQISAFVARTRARALLSGLAGSLTLDDIMPLRALEPDYLGFRGALCGGDRGGAIDMLAVARTAARMRMNLSGVLTRA